MCEHWLPLEIANVSLSFLLQMLHVKHISNWTLRFGAVAIAIPQLLVAEEWAQHSRRHHRHHRHPSAWVKHLHLPAAVRAFAPMAAGSLATAPKRSVQLMFFT
jgi:hypothetical protein